MKHLCMTDEKAKFINFSTYSIIFSCKCGLTFVFCFLCRTTIPELLGQTTKLSFLTPKLIYFSLNKYFLILYCIHINLSIYTHRLIYTPSPELSILLTPYCYWMKAWGNMFELKFQLYLLNEYTKHILSNPKSHWAIFCLPTFTKSCKVAIKWYYFYSPIAEGENNQTHDCLNKYK